MLLLTKQGYQIGLCQARHKRHSFASHFMMRGGSLLALSKILGHASPAHVRGVPQANQQPGARTSGRGGLPGADLHRLRRPPGPAEAGGLRRSRDRRADSRDRPRELPQQVQRRAGIEAQGFCRLEKLPRTERP